MNCPACGFENQENDIYCKRCGTLLTDIDINPLFLNGRITRNLELITNLVEQIKKGEISITEFEDILNIIYDRVLQHLENIDQLEFPDYISDSVNQQIEIGIAGMNDMLAGIEELVKYVDDQDISHLDNGLAIINQATDELNIAIEMAKEEMTILLEEDE